MEIYIIFFWLILGILSIYNKNKHNRNRGINDKVKIVLIIVLFYYIIYFLLGTIFEYKNSPYSFKIQEIFKNIFYIIMVKIMMEIVRTNLVLKIKSTYFYIAISIVFATIQISFNIRVEELLEVNELVKYILSEAMPIIAESALLTYLSVKGKFALNLTYTIPTVSVLVFAPIFPNIDWFFSTVLKYAELFCIFIFVNYEIDIQSHQIKRKDLKQNHPIKNIPIIIILILLASFCIGILKYKPVAIMSNSMSPVFSKGSVCIIKKLNKNYEIKIDDIIEYKLDDMNIIHRVIKINNENGNIEFITKGDKNNIQDLHPVKIEQVIGIFIFKIPYIGYPSVWFSELFL